jgi:hypothetical protein
MRTRLGDFGAPRFESGRLEAFGLRAQAEGCVGPGRGDERDEEKRGDTERP